METLPELSILNRSRESLNITTSCNSKRPLLNTNNKSKTKSVDSKQTSSIPNNKKIIYDLTNGSHTNDLFPKALWKKYTLECLERLDKEARLSFVQDSQGELYLRKNLRSYLARIRGINCTEEQIIITAGLQQSLDYICKIFSTKNTALQPRKNIIMEEPGYNKAAAVFANNNLTIKTIPVDSDGLQVSLLSKSKSSCAIYTTPSHQFPTGVTMPLKRRLQLLDWANKTGTYIIEDDFDSELRYYAKPIPSLQSIDVHNSVIYCGTFSKVLSPSIRMGYMILPPELLEQYKIIFKNYNCTAPLLNQYVIARLIETGQYDRHIRRMNIVFRKRLEKFLGAFSSFKDVFEISSNGSGQYFLLRFKNNFTQDELIQKADNFGVRVYSTMQFWRDKAECPANTLFLGFSKISLEEIDDCVLRLKKAWGL